MGRVATGVRGMRLGSGDRIVDLEVSDPLPDLPERRPPTGRQAGNRSVLCSPNLPGRPLISR